MTDDDENDSPEGIDLALAKLDQVLSEVAHVRECLGRLDRGQDTLIARVNKLHQKPRKTSARARK